MKEILNQLGLPDCSHITPFLREEDGSEYEAWEVTFPSGHYVLKKAKGCELAVYASLFENITQGAPCFRGSVSWEGSDYFLMDYAEGESLCKCDRQKLTKALDALISLQDRFWQNTEKAGIGYTYEKSLPGREKRLKSLPEKELRNAYQAFLRRYAQMPRTLCHDDLLPFNVLLSRNGATLIDWEYAGILPYPASLARLIAHFQEREDYLFSMPEADKFFAVQYYYENLIKRKGISWEEYLHDLKLTLLYEYAEWIMLNAREDLYTYYLEKARKLVAALDEADRLE